MAGDSTIEEQLPPTRGSKTPTSTKPSPKKVPTSKPAPVKPPVKSMKTSSNTAPAKPLVPGVAPTGGSIFKKWWLWVIIVVVILGIAGGAAFMFMGGESSSETTPPGTDSGNQGGQAQEPAGGGVQVDMDLDVFSCAELVQINKGIIDISCEENAIVEVAGGIDYINTIYGDSEENACVNGPSDLITYVTELCGAEVADTLSSMIIEDPTIIPLSDPITEENDV